MEELLGNLLKIYAIAIGKLIELDIQLLAKTADSGVSYPHSQSDLLCERA